MFARAFLAAVLTTFLTPAAILPAAAQQKNDAVDSAGHAWWQHAVFYEIYPRSFADSNNDGIGDLPGITSRLDYLHWLGVDAIWIAPMFPSPNVDWGYDISDYRNVDPDYGTLKDMDKLIAQAKRRNVRVLLDLVRPEQVVSGVAFLAHQSQTRLVYLARWSGPGPAAQQLDGKLRWLSVAVRPRDYAVVLSLLLSAPA